jgi:hypothetical protein
MGLERWIISYYGEYYSFESGCKGCKRGEGGGRLLSTMVMEYFYGNGEVTGGKECMWKRANIRSKGLDF